jgi:hypothetical protein
VTDVYLEVGQKRVFAAAIDWPGWCRAAKDEQHALEALAAYAPRYAPVARAAGLTFPTTDVSDLKVVERVTGSATTDFGAPGAVPQVDTRPLSPAQAKRISALLRASWKIFDRVVDKAPSALRKGPRGGGRDRDKIVDHVLSAEPMYARQIGLRHQQAARDDTAAVAANRSELIEALQHPRPDAKWPPAYAARRIAWHALDHAWEIEDRSEAEA